MYRATHGKKYWNNSLHVTAFSNYTQIQPSVLEKTHAGVKPSIKKLRLQPCTLVWYALLYDKTFFFFLSIFREFLQYPFYCLHGVNWWQAKICACTMFLGSQGQPKICSEYYIRHFGINEHFLYGHVDMCTWVAVQSPCICATESSTEGGIRAAGDSCLPFIVAHKHSGIFLNIPEYLDRSYFSQNAHCKNW